jgi:hypothetical protein
MRCFSEPQVGNSDSSTKVVSVLKTVRNLHNCLHTNLISTTVGKLVCGKYHLKDINGQHYHFRNKNLLGLKILMQKA